MRQESLSLQDRLLRWLKLHPGQWFNGGDLERLAMEAGYKASNASRRLRELAGWGEAGQPPLIEREERQGANGGPHTVWYCWGGAKERYKPVDEWERKSIEWYAKHRPKDLENHIWMLRYFNAIPNKPRPNRPI